MSLFDTTFIIDLARGDPGAALVAGKEGSGGVSAISVLSVHEYLAGVHWRYGKGPKEVLQEKLEGARTHFEKFEAFPLTLKIAHVSSELQFELARQGRQMGFYDLFIAATALSEGLTLVTRDMRDFAHIPKLKVETY